MKILLNGIRTDASVKAYLEELIKEYHQLNAEYEDSLRAANERYKSDIASNVYSEEHLRGNLNLSLGDATDRFYKSAAKLNEKAKTYIAGLKAKVIPALSEGAKPADYATKIGNALQFLKIEGKAIDDSTAFDILHEFVNDVEPMQRFRSVIEHLKGDDLTDEYGRTTFPRTFGRLEKCEQLIAAFAELEAMTDRLFIRKKVDAETEYVNTGVTLSVPMDGYSQLVNEQNAPEQAGVIEAMVGELLTTTE